MIREYLKELINSRKRHLLDRRFEPGMLADPVHHEELVKNGFVHIPGALTPEEVGQLHQIFHDVSKMDGFESPPRFINSLSFYDAGVKKEIQQKTLEALANVIPRYLDVETATFPFGAGFCITPPQAVKGCVPHQDPAYVDEAKSYSMSMWFALHDMTPENGCLHFIPGSHLWGNIHRSVSLKWAFDDFEDDLWEYADPRPVKAGDMLCFDNSVIHCSPINHSDNLRLAISLPVYPADMQMYTYFPEKESVLGNFASQYAVDENYFIEESLFERPTGRYPLVRRFNLKNHYQSKHIESLNREFKHRQENNN